MKFSFGITIFFFKAMPKSYLIFVSIYQERKPFDRDADLGVNRFDDAQRKLMIKKAGQIDSRFGSGQQKFL